MFSPFLQAQDFPVDTLPIRGFCIGAPAPDGVERFVKFIEEELAARNVITLILRVDFFKEIFKAINEWKNNTE